MRRLQTAIYLSLIATSVLMIVAGFLAPFDVTDPSGSKVMNPVLILSGPLELILAFATLRMVGNASKQLNRGPLHSVARIVGIFTLLSGLFFSSLAIAFANWF